jgi:hypothetical protein
LVARDGNNRALTGLLRLSVIYIPAQALQCAVEKMVVPMLLYFGERFGNFGLFNIRNLPITDSLIMVRSPTATLWRRHRQQVNRGVFMVGLGSLFHSLFPDLHRVEE